jgi:hypothetical protein
MKIFIWRHSKRFSSWSMMEEPHVYKGNYMQAEVIVLADSEGEALELLEKEGMWDTGELRKIKPEIILPDHPLIISQLINFT